MSASWTQQMPKRTPWFFPKSCTSGHDYLNLNLAMQPKELQKSRLSHVFKSSCCGWAPSTMFMAPITSCYISELWVPPLSSLWDPLTALHQPLQGSLILWHGIQGFLLCTHGMDVETLEAAYEGGASITFLTCQHCSSLICFYNGIKSLAFWQWMSWLWTIHLLLSEASPFRVSLVSVLPNFGCFSSEWCFILEIRFTWCISKVLGSRPIHNFLSSLLHCPLAFSHTLDPTESLSNWRSHSYIGLPHSYWLLGGVSNILGDPPSHTDSGLCLHIWVFIKIQGLLLSLFFMQTWFWCTSCKVIFS